MAATDQFYRNQKTLNVIFGLSCGLLFAVTLWMLADDYLVGWKKEQRLFRDVEAALAEQETVNQFPGRSALETDVESARKAREELKTIKASVADDERKLNAQRESQTVKLQGLKADYDSRMTYYNTAIKEYEEAKGPEKQKQWTEVQSLRKQIDQLSKDLDEAQRKKDSIDNEYRTKVSSKVNLAEKKIGEAEEALKKKTAKFDLAARAASKSPWGLADTIRALPILDGFASPTKIQQLWLPDLTIDYGGFRDVPRFDRCTTCHLGIDRASMDRQTLAKLADTSETEELNKKLRDAHAILKQRELDGEKLGFDPDGMPGTRSLVWPGALTAVLLGLSLAGAGFLTMRGQMRAGITIFCLGALVTVGANGAGWMFFTENYVPKTVEVKAVKLSDGQIRQFAAHPRLDLFVDSNSPHSAEKFGCTSCHAGQGSATAFNLASHTPNDAQQKQRWEHDYHYHASHYWDFPMLSKRFTESSCLKCHHEVTDLIRHGNKEEAPKLLKGYNLVKEFGCFGCHEIQGFKGGRQIGPDMRLEPSPALEYLTSTEQEKIKSDPANPPGGNRKVGPSLRRLTEKTNEEWTRKWLLDPRGFRPDTKMPHFYEQSTNNHQYLKNSKDEKEQEQQQFPPTEIHAITHYLFVESRRHLGQGTSHLGKGDTYRASLLEGKDNLPSLQTKLMKSGLSDREMKDLFDLSKRFGEVALLSVPAKAAQINEALTIQRQQQETLQELQRKAKALTSKEAATKVIEVNKQAIQEASATLNKETKRLMSISQPKALNQQVLNEEQREVEISNLPEPDMVQGRRLFAEKGCLACHAHEGTTKAVRKDELPAVRSEANHGPELTRVAAKLLPDFPGVDGRRFLVQWLLNPSIYHPRTRMPVTFLTPEQANHIAGWILSQKVTDWKGEDPEAQKNPSKKDLVHLARTYLLRVTNITPADVDQYLPETGTLKPIEKARLEALPRDADERVLADLGGDNEDNALKWYIGRKAIGRLGCYACHDIPGYETFKPIGTGLNDWGRKDPHRIAFEDSELWVHEHFNFVPTRMTRQDAETRIRTLERQASDSLEEKEQGELAELLSKVTPTAEEKAQIRELRTRAERGLSTVDRKELADLRTRLSAQTRLQELEARGEANLNSRERRELEGLRKLKLWESNNGKPPYEDMFFQALKEHTREGFLHIKLLEPRVFDYNRRVKWEDRLRMPQFRFARTRQRPNETLADFKARESKEEAEAREAVMTFILGLVAEPVAAKYVHRPNPEKLAEAKGRQVLDKYNCAGCHQVRPGMLEFRPTKKTLDYLGNSFALATSGTSLTSDHAFLHHTSWFGSGSLYPDRMTALGTAVNRGEMPIVGSAETRPAWQLRLTEALRYHGTDGVARDIPSGGDLFVPENALAAPPTLGYGGEFTDLMVQYLSKEKQPLPQALKQRFENKADDARGALPPPLIREGERVQPDWLYNFLLNPGMIRPQGDQGILLRMPKFNMSPDESRALVNYFAAVAKTTNPGAGVQYPYTAVEQREPEYWTRLNQTYKKNLQERKGYAQRELKALQQRVDDLKPKATQEKEKKELEVEQAKLKELQEELDSFDKRVASPNAYGQDALRLLMHKDLCIKCHDIGNVRTPTPQAPNLAMAESRLRPGWTMQWIANPPRMFPYKPLMPQNFPNGPRTEWNFQNYFAGTPREQSQAVRDALMDFQRLSNPVKLNPMPESKTGKEGQ